MSTCLRNLFDHTWGGHMVNKSFSSLVYQVFEVVHDLVLQLNTLNLCDDPLPNPRSNKLYF